MLVCLSALVHLWGSGIYCYAINMTFDVLSQISSTNKISKWKWLYSTEFFSGSTFNASIVFFFFFFSCFHLILFHSFHFIFYFMLLLLDSMTFYSNVCIRVRGTVCVCMCHRWKNYTVKRSSIIETTEEKPSLVSNNKAIATTEQRRHLC